MTHHGQDNTVGAIRSGVWQGVVWEEKLTHYMKSADAMEMVWKLSNGPMTFPPATIIGPVETYVAEGYTSRFAVTSICGGTATMVHFPGFWCADKPAVAHDNVVRLRTKVLTGVSLQLNAPILRDGTCPTIRE